MTTLHQAFFETLLKTQFLPSDRMLTYQRGLVERLIRHARLPVTVVPRATTDGTTCRC